MNNDFKMAIADWLTDFITKSVYAVFDYDSEGFSVIEIFSSKKKAEKFIEDNKDELFLDIKKVKIL